MFYKVLNMSLLWKFVIFVIKLNSICPNNNPKLLYFFKKSEVASTQKALSILVNSSILDLVDFVDLSLFRRSSSYIATTLH